MMISIYLVRTLEYLTKTNAFFIVSKCGVRALSQNDAQTGELAASSHAGCSCAALLFAKRQCLSFTDVSAL